VGNRNSAEHGNYQQGAVQEKVIKRSFKCRRMAAFEFMINNIERKHERTDRGEARADEVLQVEVVDRDPPPYLLLN